jgi:hypothetical protein
VRKINKLATVLAVCSSGFLASHAQAAGWIDAATSTFRFAGWACDPSIPNYSGWVHFYRDDDKFLGALLANIPRDPGVASACGDAGVHGFDGTLSVPADYLDNNNHTVRAYFIRPDNSHFLLGNTKTVAFTAPPPPTVSGCDVAYPGTGWVLTHYRFGVGVCPSPKSHYTYTYIAGLAVGTQITACYSSQPLPQGWSVTGQGGPSGSQCYRSNSMGQPERDNYRLIKRIN